ncbi:AlpA family transcriptional regulator [Paraburkholderia sp. CNPSo 3281]|uniref:helix-turn-helix transcriptional regulator n=1 Tax=Paraburkholderia sp. CNPSo 3281 TaxID=2940933 RepID=UPI0020B89DCD|nr:AlpA family phage regulatory protein [Paraburkholderia sp. CNPSo 3281]MCP3714894.1 AlpA family phage regulatory protein [Paraburkholderia sp. CNPSo 3281]
MQTRRYLRRPDVVQKTGLSATTLWRLERDGKFPARRQLSPHCVAWDEAEIDHWLEQRERVTGVAVAPAEA